MAAGDLPANPYSPEQFDVCILDDNWLRSVAQRMDKAVEHAIGTPGLADIETARGVIAAFKRRRDGVDEAFGDAGRGVRTQFVNENGKTIKAGVTLAENGRQVLVWMSSPDSTVENIMTPMEALAYQGLLTKVFNVRDVSTAEIDGDLPPSIHAGDIGKPLNDDF